LKTDEALIKKEFEGYMDELQPSNNQLYSNKDDIKQEPDCVFSILLLSII